MGEQKKSKHTQKKEVCLFRFRIIFDPYKKLELIKKKKGFDCQTSEISSVLNELPIMEVHFFL